MSIRHSRRRARAIELKADCVVLLDRIAALMNARLIDGEEGNLRLELAEMRMRLAPPRGIKAPIVRTGYTRGGRA